MFGARWAPASSPTIPNNIDIVAITSGRTHSALAQDQLSGSSGDL